MGLEIKKLDFSFYKSYTINSNIILMKGEKMKDDKLYKVP